ncbi:aldo/keto reductase [Cellulomonas sp. ACRRI]|uniref:aldo/keto reductase n=1 Tax=Cellulomonas sp. ACRRI TaxID=2918188 RepID=UPI001EF1CAD9|nr:aldo/keto reductase [Cellulomonas sp. ACRRI]MCG7284881.1 aldo/keto reductase [Cellulomonas sp. ACRRI]
MNAPAHASPAITTTGGVAIPQIGFGLFKVAPDEARRVVEDALDVGYRHLDTASVYGNEAATGAALATSGLARDEVFVTTKLWIRDLGRDGALPAFDRSLDALGLDHVDLYLVHWPAPPLGRYIETWDVMTEIAESGRARAVGVSNFLPEHLDALDDHGLPRPAVNQIEVHPENQERHLRALCADRGIVVQAYSPLARGALVEHPALTPIADAHDVTVPQVVLRWHVQQGHVVLPKTVSRDRMAANLDVLGFTLTPSEMAAVDDLDRAARIGADPRTFTGA